MREDVSLHFIGGSVRRDEREKLEKMRGPSPLSLVIPKEDRMCKGKDSGLEIYKHQP